MQYMGGKEKIASHIAKIITSRHSPSAPYLEPFVGGASVLTRMTDHFDLCAAADVSLDLILLWTAVQSGWLPPGDLSPGEYAALRNAGSSALRAFAGFGCSFGGKWFGGYARVTNPETANRKVGETTYAPSARRSIEKKAARLTGVLFAHASYDTWKPPSGCVVYADPPYANTTGYSAVSGFDSQRFWEVMRQWAMGGAHVYVSEYSAPSDFTCIWERERANTLKIGANARAIERLFTWDGRTQ